MRARAIATSPASFTSRSMMSARTRSIAFAPPSLSASGATGTAATGARHRRGRHAAPRPRGSDRCERHLGAAGVPRPGPRRRRLRHLRGTSAGEAAAGVDLRSSAAASRTSTAGASSTAGRRRSGGGAASGADAALAATASVVASQGSATLTSPARSASSRNAMRSRSVSSASNSAGEPCASAVAVEQPRLHPVRELAQAHRAGHARAALERVQRAAQLLRCRHVVRRAPPGAQLLAGLREELGRLLEKDREHLRVSTSSRTPSSGSTTGSGGGEHDLRPGMKSGAGPACTGARRRRLERLRPRAAACAAAVSASSSSSRRACWRSASSCACASRASSSSAAGAVRRCATFAHSSRSVATAPATTGCGRRRQRRAALRERGERELEGLGRAPRRPRSRRCDGCRTACGSRGSSPRRARPAGRTAAARARGRASRGAAPPRPRECATATSTA